MGERLPGVRLALTTLTVLPVRGPELLDRRAAGTAMRLAPAVGLLLGGLGAALLAVLDALTDGPPLLACAGAIGVLALLTRGLHLDGLADLADGLGTHGPPERARDVMKQPDVGAFGVVALVLVPLVQVSALLACATAGRGPAALVLAAGTGRLAVTAACTAATPAATSTGLGALVAGTVRRGEPTVLAVVVVAGGTLWALLDGQPVLLPGLAVVVALVTATLLRRHAVRRLGGITGDVLGALVEVATTATLVVLALSWAG